MFGFKKKKQPAGYYDEDGNFVEPEPFNDDSETGDDQPLQTRQTGGGKGGGSKAVIAVALVLALLTVAGGVTLIFIFPNRWECRRLIRDFEYSCNEMDVYAILDCVDTHYLDTDDVVSLLAILSGGAMDSVWDFFMGSGSLTSEGGSSIRIEPVSYGFPQPFRDVKCRVRSGIFTSYVEFMINKEHGRVYIIGFNLDDY